MLISIVPIGTGKKILIESVNHYGHRLKNIFGNFCDDLLWNSAVDIISNNSSQKITHLTVMVWMYSNLISRVRTMVQLISLTEKEKNGRV